MRTLLRWWCGAAAVCALALSAPGLRADEETGSLKGKVTFNGKPLPAGEVAFIDADGGKKTAPIAEEGTFAVTGLKPGKYKITVATSKEKAKDKFVAIPEKFADASTSGLTYEVQKGEGTLDITLRTEGPKPAAPADGKATVTGKVTFQGLALPSGVIALVDNKGQKFSADIQADGTYKVEKVVPGQYQVTIATAKDPKGKKPFVAIPEKYGRPNTSGLTFEVLKGEQTYDVDLR
jgi:hypothetical protein